MCGIAGYFGQPSATDFTDRALRMLASRGPDGNGVWRNAAGSVSLVHTRLAIIDLSEAGRQPMEFRRTEIREQKAES
jgi:asparagine synthase (glutamine-hydrolysing)